MAKRKMDKTSKVLMVVLIAIVGIVALSFVGQAVKSDTETLGLLDYKIGALDEQGEFVKDTGSIVTRDFHNLDELEIEIAKDAMISYKVYFYNEDEEFVSADASANTGDYVAQIPQGASLFKLVITPTNDAEVSALEIGEYVGQLAVTCAKN